MKRKNFSQNSKIRFTQKNKTGGERDTQISESIIRERRRRRRRRKRPKGEAASA